MQLQPVFEITEGEGQSEVLINYFNGPLRSWLRDQDVETGFCRAVRVYDVGFSEEEAKYLVVIDRYLTTTAQPGQRERIDTDAMTQLPKTTIDVYLVTELPPALPV